MSSTVVTGIQAPPVWCVVAYEQTDASGTTFQYRVGVLPFSDLNDSGFAKIARGAVDMTSLRGETPWAAAYCENGKLVIQGKGDNAVLTAKLRKRFPSLIEAGERTGEL